MPDAQSTTPQQVTIQPRHRKFDFSRTPRFWSGDPFTTHFMNAFSVLIPYSERMVVEILRDNLEQIRDPRLQEEAQGVIRQEGTHAALHRQCNRQLQAAGYKAVPTFERMEQWVESRLRRYASRNFELSMPAAFEHFTAQLSKEVLQNESFWTGGRDNAAVDFMVWHSLEELEHQAVCYDFYKALGGRQRRMTLYLWLCWIPLTVFSVYTIQLYFLHKDRVIYRPRNFLRYLRFIGRSLPLFFGNTFRYLKRDHHPWSASDQALYDRQKARWKRLFS